MACIEETIRKRAKSLDEFDTWGDPMMPEKKAKFDGYLMGAKHQYDIDVEKAVKAHCLLCDKIGKDCKKCLQPLLIRNAML